MWTPGRTGAQQRGRAQLCLCGDGKSFPWRGCQLRLEDREPLPGHSPRAFAQRAGNVGWHVGRAYLGTEHRCEGRKMSGAPTASGRWLGRDLCISGAHQSPYVMGANVGFSNVLFCQGRKEKQNQHFYINIIKEYKNMERK